MNKTDPTKILLGALSALMVAPTIAWACPGVGVIVRIVGKPQDVTIMRSAGAGPRLPVARPRVLEVICAADAITVQNGARVTLSLDGSPPVTVQGAQAYIVGARGGSATLASNAYRSVSERLLPDMKRQPWDVRLRGPGRELGFALTTLASNHQSLTAGPRDLLVRLDGGVGAYKVQVASDAGAVIGQASATTANVVLPRLNLAPGAYVIKASDSAGASVEAHVSVVADRPPVSEDYAGMSDREVQAAAVAGDLAREHADTWSLEAEQILQAAPANGLDRDSVFELIESYGPA
ncbi:MAG TPA: hypothetical protein VII63_03100 [Caulobacteraceae bacterium]